MQMKKTAWKTTRLAAAGKCDTTRRHTFAAVLMSTTPTHNLLTLSSVNTVSVAVMRSTTTVWIAAVTAFPTT